MTRSNPYAPVPRDGRPSRIADETRSDLDTAILRLRQCGATADEISAFVDGWDRFDEGWTPELRDAWLRCPDSELLAELRAIRIEYAFGTTTEDEAAGAERRAEVARTVQEASTVIGGAIPAVLAWVGADRVRAAAVRDLEVADGGARRSTLLAALAPLVDEDPAAAVDEGVEVVE